MDGFRAPDLHGKDEVTPERHQGVGTRHNSPPVSKCKRVRGQEPIQTGRRNYASRLLLDRHRGNSPSATGQQTFPRRRQWLLKVPTPPESSLSINKKRQSEVRSDKDLFDQGG